MPRLWLVRAGKHGEREQEVLEQGLMRPGFEWIDDLTACPNRDLIEREVAKALPDAGTKKVRTLAAQLNQFVNTMQLGDLIVMPRKLAPQVAVGRVAGEYTHLADKGPVRPVKWLKAEIPRQAFHTDLLHSFGAFLTICEVSRNQALARVKAVLSSGVDPGPTQEGSKTKPTAATVDDTMDAEEAAFDLEAYGRDQIRAHLATRFAGHEFTRLIAAILEAEGYRTSISPPGADGGVDIVAGKGALGFDPPRLVVQCKSGDTVCDAPTMQALVGNVHSLNANHGLLVSWSGFKSSVDKQVNQQFFKIRFWDSDDVLRALFANYERLPEELRKLIPLKRTWALVLDEDAT